MDQNIKALLLSYAYVLVVLVGAEAIRRGTGAGGDFTRKAVHIGVGMWSVPTLYLYTDWRWGIVPPLTFIVVNYISFRFNLMPAMDDASGNNMGTVFFPISFAALLAWLWRPGDPEDLGFVAVAGLMAMTWGDAMASILGKRFGTRQYRIWGHARTMEGSLALFAFATASMTPVLTAIGQMDLHQALAYAMVAATVAAGFEACSLYGTDNLSVPVSAAGTLYLLVSLSR